MLHPSHFAALLVVFTGVVLICGARYATRLHRFKSIGQAQPPLRPGDPDPAWMTEFGDLVAMVRVLPPQARDELGRRYRAGVTRAHRRAAEAAITVAHWAGILDWVELDLEDLEAVDQAAHLAALGLLTRHIIDAEQFALLTEMWVAADLPLPGGDTPAAYTLLAEQCDTHGRWTVLRGPEVVPAETGESATQVAAGAVEELEAAQTGNVGSWRVRVWCGAITDMSILAGSPADAEMSPAGAQ